MRKTLVFKGLPEDNEDSWNKTEITLAKNIAYVCQIDKDEAMELFERVHRGRPSKHTKRIRVIHARFKFWKDKEWVLTRYLDAM